MPGRAGFYQACSPPHCGQLTEALTSARKAVPQPQRYRARSSGPPESRRRCSSARWSTATGAGAVAPSRRGDGPAARGAVAVGFGGVSVTDLHGGSVP